MATKMATETSIARTTAKPGERKRLKDGRTPGLWIEITERRKVWRYRSGSGADRKLVTLGEWPAVDLERARRLVAEQRDEQRHRRVAGLTVKQLFKAYVEGHAKPNKTPRSALKDEQDLERRILDQLGDRPVGELKPTDFRKLTSHLASSYGPARAQRLWSVTRKAFNWAFDAGVIEANPVAGIKPPKTDPPKRQRELSEAELKELWAATATATPEIRGVVRLVMLTALRVTEARQLEWDHVEDDRLVLPPTVTKTGETYIVPRTAALDAHLATSQTEGVVFPMPAPQSAGTWLRRALPKVDYVLHDLRATISRWLVRNGHSLDTADRVLNHKIAGIASWYVDDEAWFDQKRDALDAWQRHLEGLR